MGDGHQLQHPRVQIRDQGMMHMEAEPMTLMETQKNKKTRIPMRQGARIIRTSFLISGLKKTQPISQPLVIYLVVRLRIANLQHLISEMHLFNKFLLIQLQLVALALILEASQAQAIQSHK